MDIAVVGGGGGRRRPSREASPDRARAAHGQHHHGQGRVYRPLNVITARRVQIVYYLSRNGQLEHPHFMELPQLPNQHLRLKDVMERLTVLRGKGMPALYSWSCKRSYKNGYVWNDLSESDVIYPADGAEYVLKGSEIIPGCSDRFQQQLRVSSRPSKPLPTRAQIEPGYGTEEDAADDDDYDEEDDQEIAPPPQHYNNKSCNLPASTNNGTRCSRGVSTDEITSHIPAGPHNKVNRPPRPYVQQMAEIPLDDGSPPSSSSSDPPPAASADPAPRNSVLLNLIACGAGAVSAARGKKSLANVSLLKGVAAAEKGRSERGSGVAEEEAEEVRFMSEKEYFSGSIVMDAARAAAAAGADPGLKKSSSYNQERSEKAGIGEECLVVVRGEESGDGGGGVKGKCIPGRKRSSKVQQCKK